MKEPERKANAKQLSEEAHLWDSRTLTPKDWVNAPDAIPTQDPPNPVFYMNEPWRDGDDIRDDGWYFWDETWSSIAGPFETEEECRKACLEYAKTL